MKNSFLIRTLISQARPQAALLAGSLSCRITNQLCNATILLWPTWLITNQIKISLWVIISALSALVIVKAFCRYFEQYLGHKAAFRTQASLRVKLYDDLTPLSPAITTAKGSGDLLALASDDINRLEVFYAHTVTPVISAVIMPIAGLVFASFATSWPQTLVLCGGYLIGGIVLPWISAKRSRHAADSLVSARAKIAQEMSDNIAGHAEILTYQGQSWRLISAEKVESQNGNALKEDGLARGNRAILSVLWQGITILTLIILFPTTPQTLLAIVLVPAIAPALVSVERFSQSLPGALAAGRRLVKISQTKPMVVSATRPVTLPNSTAYSIELRSIDFNYPSQKRPALKTVSFSMRAGGRLGITGASGSGKSTIASLLTRTFDPSAGKVLVENIDARHIDLAELRKKIRVAPQQGIILSGTIKSNLLLAKQNATNTEIEEACWLACLDKDLANFSEGIDTKISSASDLSGGQAQRLTLAQTLLAKPAILILDEATSHQDGLTQANIIDRLTTHYQGTIIVIAHRLATLKSLDQVVVLEEGQLAETGTFNELITKDGALSYLAKSF